MTSKLCISNPDVVISVYKDEESVVALPTCQGAHNQESAPSPSQKGFNPHEEIMNTNANTTTILRPHHKNNIVTKIWTKTRDGWSLQPWANTFIFDVVATPAFDTLDNIESVLRLAEKDTSLVLINGQLKENVSPRAVRRLKSNFDTVGRIYGHLDIDELLWSDLGLFQPDYTLRGATLAWDHITRHYPALRDCGFVCQWSSSAGVKTDKVKAHFWVILDQPRDEHFWRALAHTVGTRKKANNTFIFDEAPTRTVQPNYIAAPVFTNYQDPFITRGLDRIVRRDGKVFDTTIFNIEVEVQEQIEYKAPEVLQASFDSIADIDAPVLALGVAKAIFCKNILPELNEKAGMGVNNALFQGGINFQMFQQGVFELAGKEGSIDLLATATYNMGNGDWSFNAERDQASRALSIAADRLDYKFTSFELDIDSADVELYNQRYLNPNDMDLSKRVIAVRAPMGTGKSHMSAGLVQECKAARIPVRAAAPRRSLVAQLANGWDLNHYETDGANASEYVATTIHSLHKARVIKGQWLFLDEIEQTLSGVLARTNEDPRQILAGLKHHLQAAAKVFILDAHIGTYTKWLLDLCGVSADEVHVVKSTYKPSKQLDAWISADSAYNTQANKAAAMIEDELVPARISKRNSVAPIAVSCTSKKEATKIALSVMSKNSDANVLLITSETTGGYAPKSTDVPAELAEKLDGLSMFDDAYREKVDAFLKDANSEINKYDLVVMSPSVQSGVSIDEKVSHNIMFAMTGSHTSPNLVVQQLGRCRNAENTILVCDITRHSFESDASVIKATWLKEQTNLMGTNYVQDENGYTVGVPMDIDLFNAAAAFEAEENLRRNNFIKVLGDILENHEGYTCNVVIIDDEKKAENKQRAKVRIEMLAENKRAEAAAMSRLGNISESLFNRLAEKDELDANERRIYVKALADRALGREATETELFKIISNEGFLRKIHTITDAILFTDEEIEERRAKLIKEIEMDHIGIEFANRDNLTNVMKMRDLLAASELHFMFDESKPESERRYNPAKHWTADRIRLVMYVMKKWGMKIPATFKKNPAKHFHQMLREETTVTFERVQVRTATGRTAFYVMTDENLEEVLKWGRGRTERYRAARELERVLAASAPVAPQQPYTLTPINPQEFVEKLRQRVLGTLEEDQSRAVQMSI